MSLRNEILKIFFDNVLFILIAIATTIFISNQFEQHRFNEAYESSLSKRKLEKNAVVLEKFFDLESKFHNLHHVLKSSKSKVAAIGEKATEKSALSSKAAQPYVQSVISSYRDFEAAIQKNSPYLSEKLKQQIFDFSASLAALDAIKAKLTQEKIDELTVSFYQIRGFLMNYSLTS